MESDQQLTPQVVQDESLASWQPIVRAGIEAYNHNLMVEQEKIKLAQIQGEQNYTLHTKNLALARTREWQNFALRCLGMLVLAVTALYLIFRDVNVPAGITLLTSVALLASGAQIPTKDK